MLEKLIVKNVALIEYAELEFDRGLNVLSGETGAGKSVLLDSINFVLGAKADKSMIRYGESECSVSATFTCPEKGKVAEELKNLDIDFDEQIIISRKFRSDGRGDIKVNGVSVNAAMLRRITSGLVDVHGQSEHFYLLSEAHQLELVDRFAGAPVKECKEKLQKLADERKSLQEAMRALGGDDAERGRRLDILRYQIREIEEADLKDGEEEILQNRKIILSNAEKILVRLSEAAELLGADNAALDCLNGGKRALGELSAFGEEYESLYGRLESLSLEAEDVLETVRGIIDDFTFDEREAEEVESRLDLIKSLERKYGSDIPKIRAFYEGICSERDLLEHSDEESVRIAEGLKKTEAEIYRGCLALTQARKKAAEILCEKVEKELSTLNIRNARFSAEFDDYGEKDVPRASGNGLDSMRLMFSANKGEPLKPLSKVISGGEMSRLMLAIKTKTSDINEISTYIFDEIDAGISGNTAKVVAEKFADISRGKQIIAVSHLAQIAAMADVNFLIYKTETDSGKTVTNISELPPDQKRSELIRLLGGDEKSEAAATLASELMHAAEQYKNK